jgi:hypothetical protein
MQPGSWRDPSTSTFMTAKNSSVLSAGMTTLTNTTTSAIGAIRWVEALCRVGAACNGKAELLQ